MVEITTIDKPGDGGSAKPRGAAKSQQLNKLYSLPAPIRTFPLPTFLPHNPISLLQLVYTWVSQTVNPPSSHPGILYEGWLSSETRSVHVIDQRSIRALWEQGFYGKGSLSRSEPSWLDREKRRQGTAASKTSEEVTRQRRLERQQAKWERARKEREAIDQTLIAERDASHHEVCVENDHSRHTIYTVQAPVSPLELLALPNSDVEMEMRFSFPNGLGISSAFVSANPDHDINMNGSANSSLNGFLNGSLKGPVNGFLQEPALIPSSELMTAEDLAGIIGSHMVGGHLESHEVHVNGDAHVMNGSASVAPSQISEDSSNGPKRRKSVRFSPTVERTTFIQSEPPSPKLAATLSQVNEPPLVVDDQEHLQLTLEEALFLSYGLGVLNIRDSTTGATLSTENFFALCRQAAHFPPSKLPASTPDDPFLISYVVYHHFRSLGWVVRGGVKFSVDYLLYNRGPVFSHAEFAVMILPAYSDAYWSSGPFIRDYVEQKEKRSWSWLHCVNRVNSQVKKTLILVYVDVPPPLSYAEEETMGINGVLARYKVREIVLKRWLSNRSRD